MTAQEAQSLVSRLTLPERRELLKIVKDAIEHESVEVAPGIFKTPGICGGNACIQRMRFPVWQVEEGFRNGHTEASFLEAHPNVTTEDLANARAYIENHREEIEQAIRENDI